MVETAREAGRGRRPAGDEPERTCIVTRAKGSPESLIRFVLGPEGRIVPDLACRLPGRGVWVSCSRSRVAEAARTGAFARALKRKVTAGDDLPGLVEALLVRRAVEALSLANKAGLVVPGATKAEILIARGEAMALAHAREASEDGARKLDQRLRAVHRDLERPGEPAVVRDLDGEQLSLAMGRPHVVHAALRTGGAARNFLREAGRLQSYRANGGKGTAEPSGLRSDTERA